MTLELKTKLEAMLLQAHLLLSECAVTMKTAASAGQALELIGTAHNEIRNLKIEEKPNE